MLEEGAIVEDFTLQNGNGESVSLSDFAGKNVVVYFYPKDDTPGCTKEACGFRDNYAAILAKEAVVLGISADSVKAHAKFSDKYELPFHLLSDPEKTVIQQFGAWGEKKNYGKTYAGILRSTFILDGNRKVRKVYPAVTVEGHVEEIVRQLDLL